MSHGLIRFLVCIYIEILSSVSSVPTHQGLKKRYSIRSPGKMGLMLLMLVGATVLPNGIGLLHRCPPNTSNFDNLNNYCACSKSRPSKVDITCEGITTDETLFQTLFLLRNYTIDSVTVKKSRSLTFGSKPFKKLNIHKLIFEEVSFATAPIFRGFDGLEFTLEELHFVKCRVSHWSWGNGNSFIHLEKVRFQDTALPQLLSANGLFEYFPSKIRAFQITGCSVRALGNDTFRRFPHLEHLELSRNGISHIQRSMFPAQARRLRSLLLTGNPVSSISPDTFVNMSRLEFLSLSHSQLTSLKEEIFSPIWDQLEEIYFNGIQLRCDCDAKWMLDIPSFKTFRAPNCTNYKKPLDELRKPEQEAMCTH